MQARLKKEVAGYNLEHNHLLFHFKEAEERDLIFCQPWVVVGQTLVMEPWWPGFFPIERDYQVDHGVGPLATTPGGTLGGGGNPKNPQASQ